MRNLCVLIALVGIVNALPSETDGLLTSALKMIKECGDNSMFLCMKERALRYVDATDGDIEIGEGVSFLQTEPISQGRSMNEINLPAEPEARELEVDSLLVDRVARFLATHTLQFKVPKDSIEDLQTSLEEARGKGGGGGGGGKKHRKYLLPLLLLFKLKAAALLPLVLGFLALVAFKALIIGKLALILSGIIGLKKLFESKHSSQSYEVVASPHQSFDEHAHYGRSSSGHNLAYAAHTK